MVKLLILLGVIALAATHRSTPSIIHVTPERGATGVTQTTADRTVTLDITSEGGIGSATVTLGTVRPARLVIRLHLKGLEHFSLTQGNSMVGLAVSSAPDHAMRSWVTRLDDPQHVETLVEEGSPYWMPGQMGEGVFEIDVPKAILDGKETAVSVRWVDFYR